MQSKSGNEVEMSARLLGALLRRQTLGLAPRTVLPPANTHWCGDATQGLVKPSRGLPSLTSGPHQLKRCYSNSSKTPSSGSRPSPNAPHLREDQQSQHPDAEKEPLPQWPGGVNPHTGETGGPAGPEPTRYGDWERKGKVVDF